METLLDLTFSIAVDDEDDHCPWNPSLEQALFVPLVLRSKKLQLHEAFVVVEVFEEFKDLDFVERGFGSWNANDAKCSVLGAPGLDQASKGVVRG